MPARQPFTALCQALARPRLSGRVDLHLHTHFSDGLYSPAQLVEFAKRSGLSAIAVTDHDTLNGVPHARLAATGTGVEIVSGCEITAEYRGRELHLLAYFVRLDDPALNAALERLRRSRITRFHDMVERLRESGVTLDAEKLRQTGKSDVLGRRHLAELLVQAKKASTIREAFVRYLGDKGRFAVAKTRLPVQEAIALVRGAGGVAAWAHPPYDWLKEGLVELSSWGLGALEVEYPSHRQSRIRLMRTLAASLDLAITGGSDCHGPEPLARAVGACTIDASELDVLRRKCA